MTVDYRPLTPDFCVSPQIAPEDMAAIKAAGYVMVINNRPDGEISPDLRADVMAKAAAAAGLAYLANPIMPGAFTPEVLAAQQRAINAAGGPVFAYCASGSRCTVTWELLNATKRPVDDLLHTAAQHGYNHEGFRPLIEAFAKG